ncbi:MAG: MFS transporter [Thermoplasmata archaeon]|nr:MFS transporter [Thermoplasmata archaeon]
MVQYKWVALSNTTLGTLMASLDANIVLIALPTIGRELPGTSLLGLLWILIGYQLVTATILVNFGRLADMFGRVRLYTLGFAVFTAGSALCSLSQTGDQLIGFRMVQAIGAAFLFSNSAAILTDAFPAGERGRALGINQVSLVAGSVMGLLVGGVLTAVAGWRSIFWINIPIGIFATLWAHYELREQHALLQREKIDLIGNATFAAGLAALLLGVTAYALDVLPVAVTLLLIVGGGALLLLFVRIEQIVPHPMLDLELFRIRAFAAGNAAILLNALARGAFTLVLVFYLQGPTMHLSPFDAGVFLVPSSAALAAFGPLSGALYDRYSARILATLGLLASAAGFLMLTTLGATTTFDSLLLPLTLVGAGMGLFAAPNRAAIMNSVPRDRRGVASGTSITLTNAGATVSLGLAFLIMTAATPLGTLEAIFAGGHGGASVPVGHFLDSVHIVFFLAAGLVLAALVPSLLREGAPRLASPFVHRPALRRQPTLGVSPCDAEE